MMELYEESRSVYLSMEGSERQEEDRIIKSALSILEKRMKIEETGITTSADVVAYYRLHLGMLSEERFIVLALDIKNRIIKIACEFKGKENSCVVYIKQIIKSVIQINRCVSVIVIHNHPSGDPTPSSDDFSMTKRITDACSLVDFKLLDHIVVASQGYYSFADNGKL